MKKEGLDAIIASSPNNLGYLTDRYMGMGDRFTTIQNYVICERGNDDCSLHSRTSQVPGIASWIPNRLRMVLL
jgi:hypothetical protein